MRTILYALLWLLAASMAYGQSTSEKFLKRKDALVKYLQACTDKSRTGYSQNAMEAGMIYAVLGKPDSAFWYLNSSLDNCSLTNPDCADIYDPNILAFYHFRKYTATKEWAAFRNRILQAFNNTFTGTDKDLALQLIYAGGADQSIRYYMLYDRSPQVMADAKKIDAANLAFITRVVNKKGFPGIRQVGSSAATAAFLLVQHADSDTLLQKKVLATMKNLMKQKDIDPESYAYLQDRLLVNTGHAQVYGTQFKNLQQKILYPIADSANVDRRRKEIGLPTLSEYARSIQTF